MVSEGGYRTPYAWGKGPALRRGKTMISHRKNRDKEEKGVIGRERSRERLHLLRLEKGNRKLVQKKKRRHLFIREAR